MYPATLYFNDLHVWFWICSLARACMWVLASVFISNPFLPNLVYLIIILSRKTLSNHYNGGIRWVQFFFFFFGCEDKKHILEIYEFESGKTSIT